MRRGIAILVAVAALIVGATVLVAPSVSQAVTITSVTVTVGSTTWCDTTGSCANKIWNLGGGINLASPGNALILTQTGGANSFNFDTSDSAPGGAGCGSPTPCSTTIVVNGVTVAGSSTVLANGNADPGTATHNEATNYALYGSTAAFQVNVGYADNTHTDVCADTTGTVASNCQPDPFAASAGTTFIGGGTTAPGFVETNPNHCNPATNSCFDAGVLEIVAQAVPRVPEPSTLLLLGAGIMGLAAWGRRRRA